jgi:hypothetical protein
MQMLPEQVETEEELRALDLTGVQIGAHVWVGHYPRYGQMFVLRSVTDGDVGVWKVEETYHAVGMTEAGHAKALCGVDRPVFGTTVTCTACLEAIRRLCEEPSAVPEVARVHNVGSENSVDHPVHYNTHPVCEAIEVTEHMSFNVGNAVKYLWRAGIKGSSTKHEDLAKAAWYLVREGNRYAQLSAQHLDDQDVLPSLTPNIVKLIAVVAKHPETSEILRGVLNELSACGVSGSSTAHLRDYMGRAYQVVMRAIEAEGHRAERLHDAGLHVRVLPNLPLRVAVGAEAEEVEGPLLHGLTCWP